MGRVGVADGSTGGHHRIIAARSYSVTVTEMACGWCGRRFPVRGDGDGPRGSASDRAASATHEARRRAAELGLSDGELVVTREQLESVRDRLYVLECAVEDVERDLTERGDDPDDRERAFAWLLDAARQAVRSPA